jgi:hypothetical protein
MVTCCGTAVSWASDALPSVTCARLARLFGLAPLPNTLADVAAALREPASAAPPADFLAAAPADGSPHAVSTADGAAGVATFADALALAGVHDGPATVDSRDPVSGAPVRGGLVLTFGAGPAGRTAGADSGPETVRHHLAPYVHLFESRNTVRQWEAATPDPVAQLRIDDAVNLATVLVGAPPTGGGVVGADTDGDDRVAAYARDRSLVALPGDGRAASPITAPGVGWTPPSRN